MRDLQKPAWQHMVWTKLRDFAEDFAGYLFSAGLFSLAVFGFIFEMPEYYRAFLNYLGINQAYTGFIVAIILIFMFLSGPLMLYSASVGFWRMRELEDIALRIFGRVSATVLFLVGLANAVIPVASVAYFVCHRHGC